MKITILFILISLLLVYHYIILLKDKRYNKGILNAGDITLNDFKGIIIFIDKSTDLENFYYFKKIKKNIHKEINSTVVAIDLTENELNVNWELINRLKVENIPSLMYVDKLQSHLLISFNDDLVEKNPKPNNIAKIAIQNYRRINKE